MKFLILVLLFSTFATQADRVGYVDMAEAISRTKQGQKAKRRLEKDLKKAKNDIKSIEEKLRKDRAKLEQELPLLSQQKKAEKIQNFQQKVLQSQKDVEAKQASLQKLEDKLMQPIVEKLKKVTAQIAKKEKYDAVRNKDKSVLWVNDKLDLTKKVYNRFNKKY